MTLSFSGRALPVVIHDAEEAPGLQARAPHERPVDVGLCHQGRDVVRLDTTAVQDTNLVRRPRADLLPEPSADGAVDFLSGFGGRIAPGSDGPDRFVGENDTRKVLGRQAVQTRRKLLTDYSLVPSRLAFK